MAGTGGPARPRPVRRADRADDDIEGGRATAKDAACVIEYDEDTTRMRQPRGRPASLGLVSAHSSAGLCGPEVDGTVFSPLEEPGRRIWQLSSIC